MSLIYFIIIFFILIFNILIPIIIQKIELENQIFNSDLGLKINKVKCHNNKLFILERKINGLEIFYFIDKDSNFLTCEKTINDAIDKIKCGNNGEFNNRNNPCFVLISELLFYKNIKVENL